jgi:hypothetical protein
VRSASATSTPVTSARATVFGLDVYAADDVPFLAGAGAAPTGHRLDMSIADTPHPSARDWPGGGKLLCDQRDPEGSIAYRIEAHAGVGYRIWGPDYGTHLLSPDGRRLRCFTGATEPGGWQRLLIAQVLPFASALQGFEVFHAGAVVIDGRAIAFTGASRSGKTSVVMELCDGEAGFLADDVLCIQRAGDGLVGHPGTPLAGVDHAEGERRREREGDAPSPTIVAVNERESLVRVAGAEHPAPLEAMFFLERLREGPAEPRFEPVSDPRSLLTSTFNFVLTTPERLRGLLEVCGLLAERRVERIVFGPTANAAVVAAAVRERLSDHR